MTIHNQTSNYIFILDLTHGFNRLGKDKYKMRLETFKFWVLMVTQWGMIRLLRHQDFVVIGSGPELVASEAFEKPITMTSFKTSFKEMYLEM